MTMAWNYHRDAQGRNVYQVNVNSPPHHHHNHIHGPNSGFDGSCPGYILKLGQIISEGNFGCFKFSKKTTKLL